MGVKATDMIEVARKYLGCNQQDGSHMKIVDIYNGHKPLARGYKIQKSDSWCDVFISACAIKAGAVDLIGTECGCENHVNIFKKKGIWIEDGTITPKPGDLILYNWDDVSQPNTGYSDHIGLVEKVDTSKKQITVIEGNKSGGIVGRRTIPFGWGYVRGYARPKYDVPKTTTVTKPAPVKKPTKTITQVAKECIAGKWGNGNERKKKLEQAGYNYKEVQKKVNELL